MGSRVLTVSRRTRASVARQTSPALSRPAGNFFVTTEACDRNTVAMTPVRTPPISDEALLDRAARDPQAFGLFYDRFEAELLRFFLRATHRGDLAADLTAEVFAGALASLASFDSTRGHARAWLYGIARHELADAWERGAVEDRARRRLRMEPLALTDERIERIEQI